MATPQAAYQVTSTISSLEAFANGAVSDAEAALEALAAVDIPVLLADNVGPIAEFQPYELKMPSDPGDMNITGSPTLVDIVIPPDPTRPSYTFPPNPVISAITIPSKPALTNPTMDSVTLGALLDLLLPSAPDVNIAAFTVTPPDEITITPGTWAFTVNNILISDDPMVQAIIDRLTDNIQNGGTGLTPEIEDAIWNRDSERMEQQLSDSTDKVMNMWAKKGFTLPDGLLAHSLSEVQKEYMNKRIDRSREIAIEQAKLEQANIFKSLEIATSVAFKLIDALTEYEKLTMSAQELTAKYANEYIRLTIETHNSNIDRYKAMVQAYEILVRSAMVEVEIYKAELEGELAKVNINEATVKVYSEQITAAIAKYRGQLEGNQLLTQIYSTEMQGALTESQVNESIVRVYSERVRAVMAEIDVYKADVDAFAAKIGAEKTKIDANIAQITAWSKTADVEIAAFNGRLEEMKAWSAYNISTAEINNKASEFAIRLQLAFEELQTNRIEISSRAITAKGNAMLEAARGVAVASSSMAAGAMAAVSAHAQISYSESMALVEE